MTVNRIHQLVKQSKTPPETVVKLLENTLIGTEGTLYKLLDTPEKIRFLHHPLFIYIERNNEAIGNVTLCQRKVSLPTGFENTYYIRYFAFAALFQGSKQNSKGNSNFHEYFRELFNTSNLNPAAPEYQKKMFWAFIDPQNMRSFNMHQRFGFEVIGEFNTFAFSRFKPKKRKGVEPVSVTDQPTVLKALDRFYENHMLYSQTHIFHGNHYYVLKKDGKIVCGIQANPVHWEIKSLPGISGEILLKYGSKIPFIRKIINPKNHQFLATEGLFWEKGYETEVEHLLEGVLALSGYHSLLMWVDSGDLRVRNLPISYGFLQKIKKDNPVNIVAKFNHYSPAEKEQIKTSAKYLSGFDMT